MRALVIGLGGIGMQIDLHLDPAHILHSHCRALSLHPGYELVGAVDLSVERRDIFADRYGRPAFADLDAALAATSPDIFVIAVPTSHHAVVLNQVLDCARPVAILCEKPLSIDLTEARQMVERCAASGTHLFVNYIRHSDPGAKAVGQRLWDGRIAKPIKGVAWYSKGLFNNGSHFIALLEHWLGPLASFSVTSPGLAWRRDDPEPDVLLRFQAATIQLLAAREEDYSHYAIELVSPSGRLRYDDGGAHIAWQPAIPNPHFPGYRQLAPDPERIAVGLDRIQWHVFDEILADLQGRPADVCSGQEALSVLEHLAAIRNAL